MHYIVKKCQALVKETDLTHDQLLWAYISSLPKKIRPNQAQFARYMGYSVRTLIRWSYRDDFRKVKSKFLLEILKEKTPLVLQNLLDGASLPNNMGTVNVPAIKLWLQYIEDFKEGVDVTSQGDKIEVVF